jgi:hypothetical protein
MAKVSRSTWSSTLATNIQDNTAADILPSEVRTVFGDLEDSVVWYEDNLTGAFTTDVKAIGTVSSGTTTLAFTDSNFQTLTNGGAFTLAPPSSGNGSIILQITNNGSAGAITTSGFSSVTGDAFTTTNAHNFICTIVKVGSRSYLTVLAASDNA